MLEGGLGGGVPGLSLPAAGCGPSPAPCCPAPHEWGHPLPARAPGAEPVPPHGARAPAAPRWVAAAGAAGSGCVTLCLLGREQTTVEKPCLCLASRCLRSAAACPHPSSAPGTGAAGTSGARDVGTALWGQSVLIPSTGQHSSFQGASAPEAFGFSTSCHQKPLRSWRPPRGYREGRGSTADPWPDGRIPMRWITSGVMRRLGLGLLCSSGH